MQSVKLNLIPGAVLPVVNVSQYDVKRTFQLAVYDGAASYDLTGKTVTIRGTKPDNHGFDYGTSDGVVSVSGNTVTISTTQQMTAVGGHVMAELRIESGTTVIGTLNFIIDVEPSALSDDTIISDTEIPVIERSAWEQVEQAEKWATGAHDGTPVGPSEPQFENSAKWWAQHASTLGGLTDVDIESPTNDQVLKYDSETQKWKNSNGGGGASALDDLTDVDITSPASGQTLVFNSVTNKWENINSVADTMLPAEANTVLGAHNLFRHSGVTKTISEATITVNSDRSITITTDGSISAFTEYDLCERYTPLSFLPDLKAGKEYIANGSPEDSVYESHYWFIVFYNDNNVMVRSINFYGTPTKFIMPAGATKFRAGIVLQPGATLTNAVYKPMIRLASDPDGTYVPYAMTNKELTDTNALDDSEFTPAANISIIGNWSAKWGKLIQVALLFRTSAAINANTEIFTMPKYKLANGKTNGTVMGCPLIMLNGSVNTIIQCDMPSADGAVKFRNLVTLTSAGDYKLSMLFICK